MAAPQNVREILAKGYTTQIWSRTADTVFGPHSHPYDKIIAVLEGSIRFDMPEVKLTHRLDTGDSITIPAGTSHSASVGPAGVTCLEGQKTVTN